MTLIRWQPWQEVEALSRQIDRLFEDAVPANRNLQVRGPAIELKTTDTDVILRAELPGIEAKDLDIQVTREAVAIAGEYRTETKTEDVRFFRSEFRSGSFRRVVPLPVEVQNDQVGAEFKDGILTLTLPKREADRNQVVKINLTGAAAAPALDSSQAAPVVEQTAPDSAIAGDAWGEGN